jgi:hypothetical protein
LWKQLVDEDLVELNQEMAKSGIPGVSIYPRRRNFETGNQASHGEE